MKDKQTFHKGDGGQSLKKKVKRLKKKEVKKALKEAEGTGSHYDGYTIKDYKRDQKSSNEKTVKKAVKRALKDAKGTGSHYDGYTYKDYKRDKKKSGTGNHPLNK